MSEQPLTPAAVQIDAARKAKQILQTPEAGDAEEQLMKREMREAMDLLERERGRVGCVTFGTGVNRVVILPEPLEEGRFSTYVFATEAGFKALKIQPHPNAMDLKSDFDYRIQSAFENGGVVTEKNAGYFTTVQAHKANAGGFMTEKHIGYFSIAQAPQAERETRERLNLWAHGLETMGELTSITDSDIVTKVLDASIEKRERMFRPNPEAVAASRAGAKAVMVKLGAK